jgi:phosphate transport system substrate-binding protein
MANSSREIKPEERQKMEANTGTKPIEFIVGRDALAVYVHKDNPLDAIALEDLAEVYGDGGEITKWSQLGASFSGCRSDEITRVSRQSNSGTYVYFREHVLGKRDFKLGSIDQSGSKDVVALVARTPCAIGYSGMGYATDEVKMLSTSRKKDEPAIAPTVETAKSGEYPISRPLYIYTAGEPTGATKAYLEWVMSAKGQRIVLELGYVPVIDLK